MTSFIVDIKDYLVAGGLSLTFATNLFIAKEPATPDYAITLYGTGGFDANPKFALDNLTFQVRVRGTVDGYVVAENKLIAIKNYLLGAGPATINGNKIVGIWTQGDYGFLQYDSLNRPIFYLNCRAYYQPSVTGNRIPLG